jgi:hypothetical protein
MNSLDRNLQQEQQASSDRWWDGSVHCAGELLQAKTIPGLSEWATEPRTTPRVSVPTNVSGSWDADDINHSYSILLRIIRVYKLSSRFYE